MSVYIILNYFEECKEKKQEPTLKELKKIKKYGRNQL